MCWSSLFSSCPPCSSSSESWPLRAGGFQLGSTERADCKVGRASSWCLLLLPPHLALQVRPQEVQGHLPLLKLFLHAHQTSWHTYSVSRAVVRTPFPLLLFVPRFSLFLASLFIKSPDSNHSRENSSSSKGRTVKISEKYRQLWKRKLRGDNIKNLETTWSMHTFIN